jgi:hypothetical protein
VRATLDPVVPCADRIGNFQLEPCFDECVAPACCQQMFEAQLEDRQACGWWGGEEVRPVDAIQQR